ncbi:MAG TPA: hypothetical protein PLK33_04680 [bacterium]|nr:hypothetical protein [bacterium]
MALFGRREDKKVDSGQILADLRIVSKKYLGDKADSIVESCLKSIGKDTKNFAVDDLTPLINKLIENVVNPLKKADFRAELFEVRRKYTS